MLKEKKRERIPIEFFDSLAAVRGIRRKLWNE